MKKEGDSSLVELKVSNDRGESWQRRKINMSDIDESGLCAGELFQFNGAQYEVIKGDEGLGFEKLKKPIVKIKTVNKFQ